MTDALSTTRGAGSLAPLQPTHAGKVGDKWFTPQAEPEHRSFASSASRSKGSVLRGVKRLLRAAIHAPPRAGRPLRQARRELDAAHERLLRTTLGGETPGASCAAFAFALDETIDAEAAFVVAGGRIAALHADDASVLYMPALDAFTFTELLLLRERLPRLVKETPDMAASGSRARALVEQALRAVEKEIGARDQPFKTVLRILAETEPLLDELDNALYALACTVSARERRGESPCRFLCDLAASRGSDELEKAAAALASAPIRLAYATAPRYDGRERLAVSAHDGGAGACARILKHAVDDCIQSRLIVRARLDLKQGVHGGRAHKDVVGSVLDALAHGLSIMNGDIALARSQRDARIIGMFVQALAGYDGADLAEYTSSLSDAALREAERHLAGLPAARRKALQHAVDAARRHHTAMRGATGAVQGAARHLLTQAVENVGMRASPILARILARMRADLSRGWEQTISPTQRHLRAASPPEAPTRMSFDVMARTDGTYEISVSAQLGASADGQPPSLVCKHRVGTDLRPLRGEFRQTR